jgi:hypothetical protein
MAPAPTELQRIAHKCSDKPSGMMQSVASGSGSHTTGGRDFAAFRKHGWVSSAASIPILRPMTDVTAFTGQPHDFDFLVGRWHIVNRRLRERHVGSSEWHEFTGSFQGWSHLGGLMSVDETHFESEGFSGSTLRTLDLATAQWSIYWISSRSGRLEPPVHGGWNGHLGEFYGDDEDGGLPVRVRFVWRRLEGGRARWEQAFSLDAGQTWETNWTMDFPRVD